MLINVDALCDIHIGDIDLTGEMIGQDVATKHYDLETPNTAPACAGVEFGDSEEEDPSFITPFIGSYNETPDDFDYEEFMGVA